MSTTIASSWSAEVAAGLRPGALPDAPDAVAPAGLPAHPDGAGEGAPPSQTAALAGQQVAASPAGQWRGGP
ncbi:MAG: hypothetical protein ACK5X3_01150 [Pseudomonadota bacterium]